MVIRVALVNDDEVVVRGLDSMLRNYSHRIEVVELVAGKQVSEPVDVALYDTFGMGQGNGTAVEHLVESPRVKAVAVYTWNFQPWLTRDTLNQGVRGYLSKSLPAARLVEALCAIAAGQLVVSPSKGRSALVGGDWPGRAEGLTAREAEVLSLITMGLSNQEIAERTLAVAQLDQVLHPLRLPQDRRRLAVQGRPLGRRARAARRPGADQRVAGSRGLTAPRG